MIRLLGGLAMLLYGIEVMGDGLVRCSAERMRRVLEKTAGGVLRGVLTGAAVTAILQSSTAVIVLTVTLMRGGALKLRQAAGIVMGANIGTTVTAQMTRLAGVNTGGWLALLNPENLAPMVMICGIVLILFVRRESAGTVGSCLMGFGILFTGLVSMTAAVAPLGRSERFLALLSHFSERPLSGIGIGLLLTVMVQSSSAMTVMLQALSSTGALSFSAAYPIIMGCNLGTCVITAVICCIGTGREEKCVGLVHVLFNMAGTLIWLAVLTVLRAYGIPNTLFWLARADSAMIANFQTLFNVLTALALLPFSGALVRAALVLTQKRGVRRDSHVDFSANLE